MRFSGDALSQRRLARNMSRADLAVAIRRVSGGEIKATERGVRGWEKNEYTPHADSVPAIAEALECNTGDLFESNGRHVDDDEDRGAKVPQSLSVDLQRLAQLAGILERRPELVEDLLAAEAEASR